MFTRILKFTSPGKINSKGDERETSGENIRTWPEALGEEFAPNVSIITQIWWF